MIELKQAMEILLAGKALDFEQARSVQDRIFDGQVPEVQVAAFLTALRAKGEDVDEIAGLASSLRDHAVMVEPESEDCVDVVGTGGAKIKIFNISTAAAFVTAGAGAPVAKHGNRAITSLCGAADILTAMGVNVSPGPEIVKKCIDQAGIGFMFAPSYHPAMKYVQPVRKALGFRTVFNILGPLANPARVKRQLTGVADEKLIKPVMHALRMLGIEHAMVVNSEGLDEISIMGPTKIMILKDGNITEMIIEPEDFGIKTAGIDQLKGGDAQTNAEIVRDILSGRDQGPRKDLVVLNAAGGLIVAGLANNFAEGIELAGESIASGKAQQSMEKMVEISNSENQG